MVKEVRAEGTTYLYVTAPLNGDLDAYAPLLGENAYQILGTNNVEGVGMILEQNRISNKGGYFISYLYWLEIKDLDDLDDKVFNDTYSDGDFKYAVKTFYVDKKNCLNCGTKSRCFEVDFGNPYLGNKELLRIKTDIIFSKKVRPKCPGCELPFQAGIVKVI